MCPSHTLFPKQHTAGKITKTRHIVLIFFGETSPGKFLFWIVEALMMGPIGCQETSVRNYHYSCVISYYLFFTNLKVMYSSTFSIKH
jgi:hypothetical protein